MKTGSNVPEIWHKCDCMDTSVGEEVHGQQFTVYGHCKQPQSL